MIAAEHHDELVEPEQIAGGAKEAIDHRRRIGGNLGCGGGEDAHAHRFSAQFCIVEFDLRRGFENGLRSVGGAAAVGDIAFIREGQDNHGGLGKSAKFRIRVEKRMMMGLHGVGLERTGQVNRRGVDRSAD
jgi:hypothetical protein